MKFIVLRLFVQKDSKDRASYLSGIPISLQSTRQRKAASNHQLVATTVEIHWHFPFLTGFDPADLEERCTVVSSTHLQSKTFQSAALAWGVYKRPIIGVLFPKRQRPQLRGHEVNVKRPARLNTPLPAFRRLPSWPFAARLLRHSPFHEPFAIQPLLFLLLLIKRNTTFQRLSQYHLSCVFLLQLLKWTFLVEHVPIKYQMV